MSQNDTDFEGDFWCGVRVFIYTKNEEFSRTEKKVTRGQKR